MAWEQSAAFGAASSRNVEEAQRAFLSKVYSLMFAGLGATAAIAWYTVHTESLLEPVMRNMLWLVAAEFGVVLLLSFLATRLSGSVAALLFFLYAGLNGLTLSSVFLRYQLGTITEAFALTAGVFGAMTLYASVSKRDLTAWGSFLFMGLIGVLVAGLINLFARSDMMAFVVDCLTIVVFAGLTAYDNHKLRALHAASGYSGVGSLAVVGALMLYLDFINLFLAALRLLGRRR
jgi:FtsH-binding integral membrane protein